MKLGQIYFFATAILLFVLTGMVLAQSNPTITTKVESFVGYIRVEWTINSEAGIDHYEVWRSSGSSVPLCVGVVPHGVLYFDDKTTSLYKTEDQYFIYQVKAVGGPNGSVLGQSDNKGIYFMSPSSTYKRTWGSIKAMFR
jgi:hypothetical protein